MLTLEPVTVPIRFDADGVARVGGTRVTLDTVITAFRLGRSAEDIIKSFETLDLADVYAVLSYYLRHQQEVDAYLADREREAAGLQRTAEQRLPLHGIRERLLARQRKVNAL